ncbi:protein kinase domain-containing protein [Streptomyces triticirhizae]|uniref:Serine/threonine protein kinase n=1 Tax=Streptomyces triticirhizae TaxID=2483353 RepID=A0A3M2L3Y3_9ACTN|nr:serine/threonine protein kinase [Streptomyces triticirhizae]RMI29218.1 serine/threonine protein kinase [Streptomyces triticirhizae]
MTDATETEQELPEDAEDRRDAERLPPALAARYRLTGVLSRTGGPGRAIVLRVLKVPRGAGEGAPEGGGDHVFKWYDRAAPPNPDVQHLLRTTRLPHATHLAETGQAEGHPYEIAPSHGDTDLARYRRDHPGPAPTALVRAVVRQTHAALAALHARGFVHRDVTPANLVLGSLDPADPRLTLVDFALAQPTRAEPRRATVGAGAGSGAGVGAGAGPGARAGAWPTERAAWGGTLRYLSPQAALQHQVIHPSDDWWSLGMILAELAGGAHPVPHTHGAYVPVALSAGPPDLSLVTEPRLRDLCRGLLTRDPDTRWGAAQVAEWLAGGSPPIDGREWAAPSRAAPPEPATEPFPFMGREFTEPAELGLALDTYWRQTERALARRRTRNALVAWLRPFADSPRYDDADREELAALAELLEKAPAPATLVRLVSWLVPTLEPTFRGEAVDPTTGLADLAARAEEEERALSVVEDLARHPVLPLLESRPGGEGLAGVDRAWREALRRWQPGVDALCAEFPALRRRLRDQPGRTAMDARLTAQLLHISAAPERCRALLDRRVTARLRRLPEPVPWYGWLVADRNDPLRLLLAERLGGLAENDAWAARTERRARAEGRRRDADYLRAVAWLNAQQLPVALGWAAAGALAVTFPWVFLIGVADVAGLASQRSVALAWGAAPPGFAVVLALELLVARRIGALTYHPQHSLAGRLIDGAGRAGRFARRHRVLGALALTGALALLIATVTAAAWLWPLASVLAVGWWTWRRRGVPAASAGSARGRRP